MKGRKAKEPRERAKRPPKQQGSQRGRNAALTASAGGQQEVSLWVGGDWLRQARVTVPQPKQAISFRVDPDVLGFFKEQGPRYQTRMNAVLRAYMTAQGEDNQHE